MDAGVFCRPTRLWRWPECDRHEEAAAGRAMAG